MLDRVQCLTFWDGTGELCRDVAWAHQARTMTPREIDAVSDVGRFDEITFIPAEEEGWNLVPGTKVWHRRAAAPTGRTVVHRIQDASPIFHNGDEVEVGWQEEHSEWTATWRSERGGRQSVELFLGLTRTWR